MNYNDKRVIIDFIKKSQKGLINLLDFGKSIKTYGYIADIAEMFLNNVNVENEIRSIEVSRLVSKIAEISEVRTKLVEQQQAMGKNKGIVMDGRDIGTVVFPGAELKLFMNATAHTRAKRRYDELVEKGQLVSYDEVLKNVQERDYIDTHREDSPLVKAQDAIEIDNSTLTKKEQFDLVLELIHKFFA
jgi:cytidylate kinase